MKRDITMIQRNRANRETLWQHSGEAAETKTARGRRISMQCADRSVTLYLYEQAAVLESISSLSVTMMFRAGHKTRAHAGSEIGTVPLEIYTHSLEQEDGRVRIVYDVLTMGSACESFELEVRENQHEAD